MTIVTGISAWLLFIAALCVVAGTNDRPVRGVRP